MLSGLLQHFYKKGRTSKNVGAITFLSSHLIIDFLFLFGPFFFHEAKMFFFFFFLALQPWMCSVCSGLLYNRSSDFISCNKYFRILRGVSDEFFTESGFSWTLARAAGGSWTALGMSCQER